MRGPAVQGSTPGDRLLQRGSVLCILTIISALLIPGPASAQAAGETYVSPRSEEDEYFDAIERVEGEYGPYAAELSDLYLGLGQSLLNAGDYEQALDAFHRGVLVVRVNSGPNSPEQINHLYLIANIMTLIGESEEAEDVLRNIHFINWDHYGENNPELLPALERLYDWFLLARPPGSPMADHDDYLAMIQLSEEMAAVSESTRGLAHANTARAYRRLGEAQFQMARQMIEYQEDVFVPLTIEAMEASTDRQSVARKFYDSGRQAFRKYLECMSAIPTNTPPDLARARVELADWLLVLGRSRLARRYYEEAYQTLARGEEYSKLADSYLSQPAPVYFLGQDGDAPDGTDEEPTGFGLDISMTVTRSGEARHVEIIDPPGDLSEDDLESIEREIRDMTFRPALRAGEVVTTEDFQWRYPREAAAQSSG